MIIDDVCHTTAISHVVAMGNWNQRNTKPPLASWASWRIFENTVILRLVTRSLSQIKSLHQWWYSHRDTNHNGSIEFGATSHPEHNNHKVN